MKQIIVKRGLVSWYRMGSTGTLNRIIFTRLCERASSTNRFATGKDFYESTGTASDTAEAKTSHMKSQVDSSEAQARFRIAQNLKNFALFACRVVATAAILALSVDVFMHDGAWYQRYSMKRKLLARVAPPPNTMILSSEDRMASTKQLPSLRFRTLVVLGPSGCGKSTFASDIALAEYALPDSAPVALIRLRSPMRFSPSEDGTPYRPSFDVDDMSGQICSEIGFPPRSSFLGEVWSWVVDMGRQTEKVPRSATRAVTGLAMFFDVCEEIKNEGVARGRVALKAAPLVIFDDAECLIQSSQLYGERVIFNALVALIVAYSADRLAIRAVMTGGSGEFFSLVHARSARGRYLEHIDLSDPAEDVMASALERRGYSANETRAMIARCGTRLRLFGEPLRVGAAGLSASNFLYEEARRASTDFALVFAGLTDRESATLTRVLDKIAAEGSGTVTSSELKGACSIDSLLPSSHGLGTSCILYENRTRNLSFISRVHAHTWPLVRHRYQQSTPCAWCQGKTTGDRSPVVNFS